MATSTPYLKNKRVLITAGPTWVPLDSVRVISNTATGKTGIALAEELRNAGAKVTLLLGPVGLYSLNKKIRLIEFRFFDELKDKIIKEIKSIRYDIVIHSAAVSDYRPLRVYAGKTGSGHKNWQLNLAPTEKIIDRIKEIDRSLFLVGFKFEPCADKDKLLGAAKELIGRARLDLAVANTVLGGRYKAYIINKNIIRGPFSSRDYLVKGLIGALGENICGN